MHVPGWHDATLEWQEAGDIRMLGIIQEQHPDRARLFMQWKRMDWPILVDSLNLLETTVVPLTLAIDEHGIVREIQPRRDELDRLRREFVDVGFLPRFEGPAPERVQPSFAESLFMSAEPQELDAVVEAFEEEVAALERRLGSPGVLAAAAAAEPSVAAELGYAHFRTGVAYRARHDSPQRQPGDFQAAVRAWERALEIDPNNYIWRRRIQQYGPRLDKPYPFYDWIPRARREIAARGEEPAELVVEPGGAEFAEPSRAFVTEELPAEPPAVDERILRDDGTFVVVETAMVPSTIEPGQTTRAHVSFVPNDEIEAHWNNEVDDLVFWIDPPEGWQVDRRVQTVPNPPRTISKETRKIELELRAPEGVEAGTFEVPGYALYYVCEDVNGICLYRRRDVTLTVTVVRLP